MMKVAKELSNSATLHHLGETDNNKYELYLNAFQDAVSQYKETPGSKEKKDLIKKAAFHGVKFINLTEKPKYLTREAAENNFNMVSIVKDIIGLLTPSEFMEVFPIRKDFKGHKWETKDYFYTRDYIKTLDINKPIGEQEDTLNFLWEYVNLDITLFNVNLMGFLSDLRQMEGYPSIAEEWAYINGIETHTMHQDNKGNDFIIVNGKVAKARKPKPKHLRIIK